LAEVRRHRDRAETIYVLPVGDDAMRLLGTVSLEDLVLAEPRQRIEKLIRQPQYSVSAWDDQETTARLIQSADLVAVPVVEKDNRLVGLVTVDDAMDVLQSEDSEDMARAGATEPIGKAYFSVSLIRLVRSRIVWLSLLALAATLTVNVLSAFETTLETAVSLALFIPLLIGIGGNTGAQSATTIIRAIATEEIDTSDLLRVLLREGLVGLILGVLLGVIAFVVVSTIFDRDIALIVALTLVTICTLAAIVGSSMPLFARILGVDPAVVSAPVVTTVVDATGLLVYFLVAAAVLGL
jgi:magnesium transporter